MEDFILYYAIGMCIGYVMCLIQFIFLTNTFLPDKKPRKETPEEIKKDIERSERQYRQLSEIIQIQEKYKSKWT